MDTTPHDRATQLESVLTSEWEHLMRKQEGDWFIAFLGWGHFLGLCLRPFIGELTVAIQMTAMIGLLIAISVVFAVYHVYERRKFRDKRDMLLFAAQHMPRGLRSIVE